VTMHSHSIMDECTEECAAFDSNGWRCSKCNRQRPMVADTEDWPRPLCDVCYFLDVGVWEQPKPIKATFHKYVKTKSKGSL
jgi:hypothetical protein